MDAFVFRSPVVVLLATWFAAFAAAALIIVLAVSQPWLGLTLERTNPSAAHTLDPIVLSASTGPSAALAAPAHLLSIAPASGPQDAGLRLGTLDLVEEPDYIPEAGMLRHFLDRQQMLAAMLRGGEVVLEIEKDGALIRQRVTPAPARPLRDLPAVFWIQIFVGLAGPCLGGWIVSLKPRQPSAWYFLLAGIGLAMAAYAAAIYSTRELALSRTQLNIFTRMNGAGTLLFGVGMINLFLIYPKRLVHGWALLLAPVLLGGWIVALVIGAPLQSYNIQIPVAAAMLALLGGIAAQYLISRNDPSARAVLTWFGLSVILGAGGFVATIILPFLSGVEPGISQGHAFIFFLAIYVGLGLGIARYRLFDLSDWAFQLVFYGAGVLLLLGLDAALVLVLSLQKDAALGLSLAVVGFAYLPLRHALQIRLRKTDETPFDQVFAQITEIALTHDPVEQERQLRAFWQDRFEPLQITLAPKGLAAPQLVDRGEALDLPGAGCLPDLRLRWAAGGRRLFSSRDLHHARGINDILGRSLAQHIAYESAVAEERSRINRDMHDNIGVQLLGALHSAEVDRKDMLIRQTLLDLREIISNPSSIGAPLPRLLADLRGQISEHMEAVGVSFSWQTEAIPNIELAAAEAHVLRAFFREGANNILRHAHAPHAIARISFDHAHLNISLSDDGEGFDAATAVPGNGIANLTDRIAACGGTFDIRSGAQGTTLSARLPLPAAAADRPVRRMSA
jgi:two-component system, NarL family, sensor histidine kinase DevS